MAMHRVAMDIVTKQLMRHDEYTDITDRAKVCKLTEFMFHITLVDDEHVDSLWIGDINSIQ